MMEFSAEWLTKLLGGGVVALAAYVWNKMDGRVTKLEAKMDTLAEKQDVKAVGEKVDRLIEKLL